MLTNFGWYILMFNKMALIFLEVLTILPFQVFLVLAALTSSLMMIEWPQFTQPQSTGLWGLDNVGVLTQAAIEVKNSSRVLKCTLVNFVLPEKAIDNAVKDYRKRLQTCVLASCGHFEH